MLVDPPPVSRLRVRATNHLTLRDETVLDIFAYTLLRVLNRNRNRVQTQKPPPIPRWLEGRNGQKLSGGREYRG
jgi:hypothetical protein